MTWAWYLIGIVLIGSGAFLYTQNGTTSPFAFNTPCTLSAIQPYSITCGINPGPSYLDSMLYTTGPTSDSGIWGGGLVGQQNGFLKVFYFLQNGATVQSTSLTYNTGGGAVPIAVQLGKDATGGGLTWFGAYVPTGTFGSSGSTTFYATLSDSFGTTVNLSGTFAYSNGQAYGVSFQVNDITNQPNNGQTVPLANAQIRLIETITGNVVGQVVTDGSGKAQINLQADSYTAQLSTPAGYAVIPGQAFTIPAAAGQTFTFNTYSATQCAVNGQTNCYPPCGSSLPNAIQTCLAQTTTTTYSGSSCTINQVGPNQGFYCTPPPTSTTTSQCGTFSQIVTQTQTQVHTTNLGITTISNTITTTTTFTSVGTVACFFNGQGTNQFVGVILMFAGVIVVLVGAVVNRKPNRRG